MSQPDFSKEQAFRKMVDDAFADIATGAKNMKTVLAMFDDTAQEIVDASNALTQQIEDSATQLATEISNVNTTLTESTLPLEAFQEHVETDLTRWQEVADLRAMVYNTQASITNKVLSDTITDIESFVQGEGFTVTNALGGIITFTATSLLISLGQLFVNGESVWSSAGLSLSIGGITDSRIVQENDVVTATGMSSITFTPYVAG